MLRFLPIVVAAAVLFVLNTDADAHMTFKKEISKKYPDMKITCNACHVNKKPKTERNEFGKLFAKQLKDKNISATFKDLSRDEKKQYEKEVMVPEFTKALEKVKKMKPKDSDSTYDELIKAGEIAEITKKPDKADEGSKG